MALELPELQLWAVLIEWCHNPWNLRIEMLNIILSKSLEPLKQSQRFLTMLAQIIHGGVSGKSQPVAGVHVPGHPVKDLDCRTIVEYEYRHGTAAQQQSIAGAW